MKKRVMTLSLAVILLLVSCETAPNIQTEREGGLFALVRELDTQREQDLEQPPTDVSAMVQNVSAYGDYSSMVRWQSCGKKKSVLSAQEAREDVDAAFDLLHDLYGGYHYFGGDEVFEPLRETMLSRLRDGEKYTARELKTWLRDALAPVLRDGHFAIEGVCLLEERQKMFFVPDIYFDDPDGLDPTYVKRTVGPEGELTYCFAALSVDGKDLPAAVGRYDELEWQAAEDVRMEAKPVAYEKSWRNGLTFLTCRSMSGDFWQELSEFAKSGGEYQELDAFVIDLRGNSGGTPYYWRKWLAGFLGKAPEGGETLAIRWPDTAGSFGSLGYNPPDTPGHYAIYESGGRWQENDRTIFCLTDGQTASAAEWFEDSLRALGHVVFVGSNTRGMMLVGGNYTYYLPNSGLSLYFGTGLYLPKTEENLDGSGWQPDLWVEPTRAAEAVVAMWNYYSAEK